MRQRLLQALFDSAAEAIVVIDDEGRYVDANAAALVLLHESRESLIGRPVGELVPPEQEEAVASACARFRASGRDEGSCELRLRDGSRIALEFQASAHVVPGRHVSILRPSSDRPGLADELQRRARLQALTEPLGAAMTNTAVVDVLCGRCHEDLGACASIVACTSGDGEQLSLVGVRGLAEDDRADWRAQGSDQQARLPLAEALATRRPIYLETRSVILAAHPELAAARTPAASLQAIAALPLATKDAAWGAVAFVFDRPQRFDRATRELLETLAVQAGHALGRARLYQAAEAARRQAEAIAAARAEVLASVAHDLRNPLTTVAMSAEIFLGEVTDPEVVRRQAEKLRRSGEQMDLLVRDLLDVAALEAASLVKDLRPWSVWVLLEEAVDSFTPRATVRDVTLRAELPDPRLKVLCDRERVHRVLANLLGNAIKFTAPRGTIVLSAQARGERHVEIAVRDDGCGIPVEDRPRVFDRYWRGEAGKLLGTGLGLAIAKDIVEAHDGRIWVDAETEVGTTVRFTLPRAR